jgi:hypothetical protein
MKSTASRVNVSAMSSSFHRAAFPPLMWPIRLIPFTTAMSCPWLGWIRNSSGWSLPVGSPAMGRA